MENLENEIANIKIELQLQQAANSIQTQQLETLIQQNKKSEKNTRVLLYGFVGGLALLLYSNQLKAEDKAAFLDNITTRSFDILAIVVTGGAVASVGLRERND